MWNEKNLCVRKTVQKLKGLLVIFQSYQMQLLRDSHLSFYFDDIKSTILYLWKYETLLSSGNNLQGINSEDDYVHTNKTILF